MNNAIRTVDGMVVLEPLLEEVENVNVVNEANIIVDNGTVTIAQAGDTTNTVVLSAEIETKQLIKSDTSKSSDIIYSLLGLNKDTAIKVLDKFIEDKAIYNYNFVVPGDFVKQSHPGMLHVILDSNDEIRSVELE